MIVVEIEVRTRYKRPIVKQKIIVIKRRSVVIIVSLDGSVVADKAGRAMSCPTKDFLSIRPFLS